MKKITYKTIYTFLSLILSLGLSLYTLSFISKNGTLSTVFLFGAAVSVYIIMEMIRYRNTEDYYELRRFSGKFLFSIIFPLDFGLLFMMLYNPEEAYVNLGMLISYGAGGILFFILSFLRRINRRPEDDALISFDFTSFIYYFYTALILLMSYLSVNFHEVWFFIVFINLNAVLTLYTVYMPFYLMASGYKRCNLTFRETIHETKEFIKRHSIFYFIGIGFMILMGVLYLSQDNTSTVYQSLFYLYVGFGILKIVFYVWNKKLGNDKDKTRSQYKIMMVSGIFILALISAFTVSIQYLTDTKSQASNAFLWFFFVEVPFLVWRFIACILDMVHSKEKNPYQSVRAWYGFASMLMSMYGLMVSVCMYLDFTYKNIILLIFASLTVLSFLGAGLRLLIGGIRGMKNRT